jgi:mono/diheme cytochrome c family protein
VDRFTCNGVTRQFALFYDGGKPVRLILFASLIVAVATAAYAALPGDAAEGKRLHQAHCTGCHGTAVYTRQDRMVKSLDELKNQVGDCSHMAGQTFSPVQAQNLVKYLNDQFYRFQ